MAITFEDLLCGSVHCASVCQVKGNSDGSVSLLQQNTKEHFLKIRVIFFFNLLKFITLNCFELFYDPQSLKGKSNLQDHFRDNNSPTCCDPVGVSVSSCTTCCRRAASRPHSTSRAPAAWNILAHSAKQTTLLFVHCQMHSPET